jgi:hypothetical protein
MSPSYSRWEEDRVRVQKQVDPVPEHDTEYAA